MSSPFVSWFAPTRRTLQYFGLFMVIGAAAGVITELCIQCPAELTPDDQWRCGCVMFGGAMPNWLSLAAIGIVSYLLGCWRAGRARKVRPSVSDDAA